MRVFDGRRLDDLIDFLTYTCLPLLLIWQAGLVSTALAWWLLVPLLASAYGFCQVSAKTDDGYFLGFPSYWNLVAFYLYVLRLEEWLTIVVLVGFALLIFIPARYLYPTQRGRLSPESAAAWGRPLSAWSPFRRWRWGRAIRPRSCRSRLATLAQPTSPRASRRTSPSSVRVPEAIGDRGPAVASRLNI